MSEPEGLYIVCFYVDPDERLTAQGVPHVRLGMTAAVDAAEARADGLKMALATFPPEYGYTGHGAFVEVAPLAWIRLALVFVREVEPHVPTTKFDHGPPRLRELPLDA